VLDTLYRVGEVVPAGQPVIEMLPPENVKLRFHVPETAVARLAFDQTVAIACDGCPAGLTATISYIASEAEFTPPVIFSRQERAKLVFVVEALPTAPAPALRPGLPVEVRPR
jgi:HlyD family secretion protein